MPRIAQIGPIVCNKCDKVQNDIDVKFSGSNRVCNRCRNKKNANERRKYREYVDKTRPSENMEKAVIMDNILEDCIGLKAHADRIITSISGEGCISSTTSREPTRRTTKVETNIALGADHIAHDTKNTIDSYIRGTETARSSKSENDHSIDDTKAMRMSEKMNIEVLPYNLIPGFGFTTCPKDSDYATRYGGDSMHAENQTVCQTTTPKQEKNDKLVGAQTQHVDVAKKSTINSHFVVRPISIEKCERCPALEIQVVKYREKVSELDKIITEHYKAKDEEEYPIVEKSMINPELSRLLQPETFEHIAHLMGRVCEKQAKLSAIYIQFAQMVLSFFPCSPLADVTINEETFLDDFMIGIEVQREDYMLLAVMHTQMQMLMLA